MNTEKWQHREDDSTIFELNWKYLYYFYFIKVMKWKQIIHIHLKQFHNWYIVWEYSFLHWNCSYLTIIKVTGEMAQRLGLYTAMQKTWVHFPTPRSFYTLTSATERYNISNLWEPITHMHITWYLTIHIHVTKI